MSSLFLKITERIKENDKDVSLGHLVKKFLVWYRRNLVVIIGLYVGLCPFVLGNTNNFWLVLIAYLILLPVAVYLVRKGN